jgi:hypothetical protein
VVEETKVGSNRMYAWAVSRYGDEDHLHEVAVSAKKLGHLVAVHARKPNIQKDEVWPKGASCRQGLMAVEKGPDVETAVLQR